jgi:CheY-like chemotaxis protein
MPQASFASSATNARVLLVEDNAINREVALELLHGSGLVIETRRRWSEALENGQPARPST